MTERLERWYAGALEAVARPVDIAWLAAYRIIFGLAMSVSAARFLAYGWVEEFFVRPSFHFKYWGFAWVEPLGREGMLWLFGALAALGLLMAAGFAFRFAAALFFVLFTYVQLIDVATYLNHYVLASLLALLLAISPAHRAFSVDAWLRGRRFARHAVPSGWLHLFRFQIGVVYFFAGMAKAHADWLIDAQPLRIWLASRTGLPLLGALFRLEGMATVFSWAGFLFDTTIVVFLLTPRLRGWAFLVVLAFHTMTRLLFPIGMFPVIMVTGALVFFSPSWPRTLMNLLRRTRAIGGDARRPSNRANAPRDDEPGLRRPRARLALCAMSLFALVQIAMPLRFLAYGGNVRWHEQGMRFSWRVMVREKNGSITFKVRRKTDGKLWHVSPRTYLTQLQEREMSGQPDLILQLAHHIRRDFERRGLGTVEVRADALVSLNGRPVAPLVDPEVDLTEVRDGLDAATWILPAPTTSPPHLRPVA